MSYAIEKVIVRRNKQYEWLPPDMKSYFNCGYISHLISECDYRPPRTWPINKRDYLNSINQYRQENNFQRQQKWRPISYAEAACQRSCNQPNRQFNKDRWQSNNTFSNNKNFKDWNYANLNGEESDVNYQDDENINNWNEELEEEYQFFIMLT
jgi:hypothetical protein